MWQYVLCLRQVYLSDSAGGLEFSDADVWDQLGSAVLGLQTAFQLAIFNRPRIANSGGRERSDAPSLDREPGPAVHAAALFCALLPRILRAFCVSEAYAQWRLRRTGTDLAGCRAAGFATRQLKHLAAFADSFGCPDDAPMVPKEICDGF
ncbi:hypothetical protein MTO96_007360 [Rhipicephalus appendiculatus]